MLVEHRSFDLTTPVLTIPMSIPRRELTMVDKAVQVDLPEPVHPNPPSPKTQTDPLTGMTFVKTMPYKNVFLIDKFRRDIVSLFVNKIDEYPNRFNFAFTVKDFRLNAITILNEACSGAYTPDFVDYWCEAKNRSKIIGEFKFDIGKKICRGRIFNSLPVNVANSCVTTFQKMVGL